MTQFTFKTCTPQEDQATIIDLLLTLKRELYLPDRQAAREITTLCFKQGGIIGGYNGKMLCGMMGYFYGEPHLAFANKEIAFMYVAGIHQEYRHSGLFRGGLLFGLRQMKKGGAQAIRLQAEAANPYTNRLYARFATPLREDMSLRGKPVITYGSAIDEALACLKQRKRPSAHAFNPTPHAFPA